MWLNKQSGELIGTVAQLAQRCRCSESSMKEAAIELLETHTADVLIPSDLQANSQATPEALLKRTEVARLQARIEANGKIILRNRRMYDAHKTSEKNSESGRKGGKKTQANRKAKMRAIHQANCQARGEANGQAKPQANDKRKQSERSMNALYLSLILTLVMAIMLFLSLSLKISQTVSLVLVLSGKTG